MNPPTTRRAFLIGTTSLAIAACSSDAPTATSTTSALPDDSTTTTSTTTTSTVPPPTPVDLPGPVFTLGIASGDALADRVILWTRLAAEPSAANGGMNDADLSVGWEVATDDSFGDIVAAGTATAEARYAHSVHVDATGLAPNTSYAYRFTIGDQVSPTGLTRTLADTGTEALSFVVATCQDPQFGEYGAWREIASREDVDLVLFTGDYIYELPPLDFSPQGDGRRAWATPPPADLDGFRLRYGQVKVDPSLQAAHALAPWFVMWDDHEITDNYWSGGPGQFDSAGGDFAARRTAAYQAWWEHQPVRMGPPTDGSLDVHRAIRHGDLVEMFLIDTRQHADEPPCRDTSAFDLGAVCGDEDRSLLGAAQEAWLLDGLEAADATWTTLVSPVMFAGLDARSEGDLEPKYYLEGWDGYATARDRVADVLEGVSNPVVLSGDYHASFALDVGPGLGRSTFAPEFMATAISSSPFAAEVRPANPHVRHFAGDNGYLHCVVDADQWTATYRTVSDIWDPESPMTTTASFAVDAGNPEMRPV